MPTVCCTACGQLTRISMERLGEKVDCPSCFGSFAAEARPESWTRFLHRRHVAGLVVGIGVLALSVVAVLNVAAALKKYPSMHDAIFGHAAQVSTRWFFWIGLAAIAYGIYLIIRWFQARRYWLPR